MNNFFESDITEAIYEVIANTSFKEEGETFLNEIRISEKNYNFELDKTNAKITIYNDNEEFTITIHKTAQRKP
jgi:hypothetical protein